MIFGVDYNVSLHKEEITVAKWIFDNFGGTIRLLSENNGTFQAKNADFEWNGKLWELKTLKSERSVDSALRKAISQIHENPGGVILDFGKNPIQMSQI